MKENRRLLTIAGSDPSGGAGIQQDLRVFASLGAYGSAVVAAITVQNTKGVQSFQPVDSELLKAQIETLLQDVPFEGVKTGMLGSADNVRAVAHALKGRKALQVVDPVLAATRGGTLFSGERKAFVEYLFPLATVVTPNVEELKALYPGLSLRDAAEEILKRGADGVVVTGGDAEDKEMVRDLVVTCGVAEEREHPRVSLPTSKSHGTGCTFSSILLAMLAGGLALPLAYERALEIMEDALRHSYCPGDGMVSPNPLVLTERETAVRDSLEAMTRAIVLLESTPGMGRLIPEIQSNLCYALPHPRGHQDVLGVKGRIVRWGENARAMGPVLFGASRHVANIVLTANRHDPAIRSAMALRYSRQWVDLLNKAGFPVASFSRLDEPAEVKEREGSTLSWGVEMVCQGLGRVPEFIYDEGDVGKEPVIRLLGTDPEAVVKRAAEVLRLLG